jgi:gas vesicle protein
MLYFRRLSWIDDEDSTHRRSAQMDAGRFFEGFLLGALIGAGITLLSTPQSGEATKGAIRQRVRLVIDEGKRAAAERRAELEAEFAMARQTPPAAA